MRDTPAVALHTKIDATVEALRALIGDAGQHVLVRDGIHAAGHAAGVYARGPHIQQLAAHGCAVHGAVEGHIHGCAAARLQAGQVGA